jgi:2-oxoisovalerate dehydrogenase E1 component
VREGGIIEETELNALEASVEREICEATDRALAAELPSKDSIYQWVYSPDVDPTGPKFESKPEASAASRRPWWKWCRPR